MVLRYLYEEDDKMSITIRDIDIYLNNKGVCHHTTNDRINIPIALLDNRDAYMVVQQGCTYYIDDERIILSSTPTAITAPAIAMLMALLDNKPCYFA